MITRHSAIAVGTFDGFHLGHQYLINKLISVARREKLRSMIVTLSEPVRPVSGMLTTIDEKIKLMRQLPLDEIVVLPPSGDIIYEPAGKFLDEFLRAKLGLKHLVVGQNFAFGFGREGSVKWLKKTGPAKGVKITIARPLSSGGRIISSTRIRDLLQHGGLDSAVRLLGRFYQVSGLPVRGRGVGRRIGFPTINLKTSAEKLLPEGVYAGLAGTDSRMFPSVINIGRRPTFFNEGKTAVEINILDFPGQWPDRQTSVYLCRYIRKEMRFSDINELGKQIAKDRKYAEEYFKNKEIYL